MPESLLPPLVDTETLQQHLDDPHLLIVDLRPKDDYEEGHIPGARSLDYSEIVQAQPPAMGMLPDEERLGRVLSRIGLTPEHHVVAYDEEGGGRAARLLWTLEALGHRQLSLLDGGLIAWDEEERPIEEGPDRGASSDYQARFENAGVVTDKQHILARLGAADLALLDARSPGEFRGQDMRARRGGHIPGAVNLNWTEVMDPEDSLRLKPNPEIQAMLKARGVTPDKEVVVYCQTHHRSAHTYWVLRHLGYPNIKGYPGAWSEWGNDPEMPVER